MRKNKPVSRIVTAFLALVLALTGTIAAAPAQPAAAASSPLASCKDLTPLKKISCVRDALKETAGASVQECLNKPLLDRPVCLENLIHQIAERGVAWFLVLHLIHEANQGQLDAQHAYDATVKAYAALDDPSLLLTDKALRTKFLQTAAKAEEKGKAAAAFGREAVKVTKSSAKLLRDTAHLIKELEVAKTYKDILGALDTMNAGMAQMNSGLDQMNKGVAEVNAGLTQANAGIDRANNGMSLMNKGISEANSALAKTNKAVKNMAKGFKQLNHITPGRIDFDFSNLDTLFGSEKSFAQDAARQRKLSVLLDLTPGLGDVKGVWQAITGKDSATGEPLSGLDRAVGTIFILRTMKAGYKGADSLYNASRLTSVLSTTEKANPLIDSLRKTGKLPPNYVTKSQAAQKGWEPGKALGNHVPGGQIGGDVFRDPASIGLPTKSGRVWYEADVGLTNTMKRSKQPGTRLLYSDDGLLYVTTDHYKTVDYVGTY
ncbi:ribonuclease domain-containing protein [Streptomyces sp. CC219B]|uniref:pre-toxin TG domain-containing protein n=1 Tax=Streptomyces sp. CC219B TaxID=3044574 RepID=UPI0024A881B8|nr:ribonuclease domain-containing protein [Streptomyces sp. CC219B]